MTSLPIPPDRANQVLIASPNPVVRERVLESLRSRARRVEQASGGAEALGHLERGSWEFLYLDRYLPDLDADELYKLVRQRFPALEVVLFDGDHKPGQAEKKVDASAAETSNSPQDSTSAVEAPMQHPNLESAETPLLTAGLPGMIGNSAPMRTVYRLARLVASRDTTVLVTGPTGSGKELVARGVHLLSPRAGRTLAVVNCAAIPESMLEAELFGYSRGAFTGAIQAYAGRIQAAHLGTLFLDEIGDMPLSLQPKLLRFLEQKELQRLGSAQVVRVDARVIAATNANLLSLVEQGKFREDLYYRLAAFPLDIPALRDRPDDTIELARYFLTKFSTRPLELSAAAASALRRQPWHGNVRELQNVMERAAILAGEAGVIAPEHLLLGAHERAGNCDVVGMPSLSSR